MTASQTLSYRQRRGQFPDAEPIANKRVMLYGLTANPPTGDGGHRGIVRHIAKMRVCDEIWVLPVYRHIYASKSSIAGFEHRLRMSELNFRYPAELNEAGMLESLTPVVVLDLEKTLHEQESDPWLQTTERKSLGTIDLVLSLKARYPTTHFSFLLGSDSFSDLMLGKWKDAELLLELLEFNVAVRPGWDIEEMRKVPPPPKCNIHVISGLSDISSSFVRKHTASGRVQREMHPAVYEYMIEHRLFGFSKIGLRRTWTWMIVSALCTAGLMAYGLLGHKSVVVKSTPATEIVDENSKANIRPSIGKLGGLMKKWLKQDASGDTPSE